MRQNPITSRIQVGGRAMPSWFSASLIRDGTRRSSDALPPPPPPPPNVPPPPEESEYEEIDHLPRYTNTNIKKPTATKRTCSLCGNANPLVRCELCNNQIFCGSCNDMYHRHPKRHNHVRKILESVENRPPLPPKTMTPPVPVVPDAPVPPPRRMKKFGIRSATSSPTLMRKVFFDPMGSLKRQFSNGMEQRPLPPPPKPAPPLPPKAELSRNLMMDGRQRQNQMPGSGPAQHQQQHMNQSHFHNSHHPTAASQSQLNRNVPLTVIEMAGQRRNPMASQDMLQSSWDDFNERQFNGSETMRARAQSVSTNHLNRFNSSSNISHIATLQRKPKRPIVCGPVRPPPPPIPPREFPPPPTQSQNNRAHHSIHSASAFNLNQMNDMDFEDPQMGMTSPWHMQSHNAFGFHPQQQQQQLMFGYPGNNGLGYPTGQIKRTPSTSSMTSGSASQPIFNPWSTMRLGQTHNQSMTSSERELEMIGVGRRGSETRLPPSAHHPPPYGNQMQMQLQMNHNAQQNQNLRNQNSSVGRQGQGHQGHQGHGQSHHMNRNNFLDSDDFHLMNRERSVSPSSRIRQERELFQFEMQRRESMGRELNPRDRPHDRDRARERSASRSRSRAGGISVVDGYWTCEWCTLINSVESNICSACCKTSTVVLQMKQEQTIMSPPTPARSPSPIPQPTNNRSSNNNNNSSSTSNSISNININSNINPVNNNSNTNIKKSSGGKGSFSGKKSGNSIVRSVLSFSRNDKENKTSARVEKQIIKMADDDEEISGSDEDDEGPGDSESDDDSHQSDESDEEEDDDDNEDDEVEPSPVAIPVVVSHRETFRHGKKSVPDRRAKTPLTSSNEEVYGSVPLQTLTIATTASAALNSVNKRETKKQQVSTGVGSSPPSPGPKYLNGKKEATRNVHDDVDKRDHNGTNRSTASSQSESGSSLKGIKPALKKMSSVESSASIKISKSIGASTTTGTSTSTSTSMQDVSSISPTTILPPAKKETEDNAKMKTSKGTSPPPQSISTQTYEELPAGKLELKSVSKSSIVAAIDLLDQEAQVSTGRALKEMSDKELRYTRRAQQQSKLKRSMSTHLTSAVSGDPWMEANEGRHLYRSSSRHSLASDTRSLPLSGPPSRDASPPRGRFYQDFRAYPPPSWDRFPTPADYFASIEDLVNRRRKDSSRNQEFELARLLKEAAESGFTPEDVQVALRMCGERNPIKWLQDNWSNMVETVQTLATKYGREKGDERNEVGTISTAEAKEALRQHRGNVWVAVTECVEQRRKKFLELQARGNFLREDILTALTANHGKLDSAYVELSKAQLKPFLMQIWGPPIGLDNEAAPPQRYSSISSPSTSSNASISPPTSEPGANYSGTGNEKQNGQQQLIEMDSTKLYEEVNPINPTAGTDERETEAETNISSKGQTDHNEIQEELKQSEKNRPDYIRSSSEDENFMDATEGEGMIAITIDENLQDDTETKEEIASSSDPEESEAFVSDFLQNFQISRNAPRPQPEKSGAVPSQPVVTNDVERKPELVKTVQPVEEPLPIYAPLSMQSQIPQIESEGNTNGMAKRKTSDVLLPSNVTDIVKPTIETTPIPSTTEGVEKLVENKLHFSMEAVLELLEQQRIKILKEAEAEKNKELLATSSAASGQTTAVIAMAMTTIATPPVPTLESESSKNAQIVQEKVSEDTLDTKQRKETTPSLISAGASQLVSIELGEINSSEQKSGADVGARNNSADGREGSKRKTSLDNVRPQVVHTQASVESTNSLEAEAEDDVDASIYEEVSNGDNLSLTEYLRRAVVPDDDDVDEESMEDETSIGDDEDADLSIESSNGSGSIGTRSDIDQDDLLEEIYEKIEPLQQTEHLQKIQQAAPAAAVQLKAETKLQLTPEPIKMEPVKEVKPEVKRLMDAGLSDSFETAELAVQLMDMKFTEEDSVHAAKECNSIYQALSYLQQECLLCAGKFSATHMVSMLRCTHWCCKTCARDYFMVQIRDHGILDATCPFCKEPSQLLEDPDVAVDYFNHLDILLKNLLDYKHHEMFQRKLRDYTLSNTPNFKWCSKCSSGFITEPLQTRLVCPDCSAVTCAVCLEPWDRTHDHRDQNTVKLCDDATKSIVDYLNENCIECPRCRLKFALARGGCMHLTCSQCKFEFCSGCSAPFRLATKCNDGPFCAKLGLHAHHPRNCLFYLRDKEPTSLAKLLEEHSIPYLKEEVIGESQTEKRKCRVSIQRETEAGLQDDFCGNDSPPGFATVCQAHYIEYLGLLIWQNRLDPISILSNDDLETIVKRAHKKCPGRPYGTKDADYRVKLLHVINEEIPL